MQVCCLSFAPSSKVMSLSFSGMRERFWRCLRPAKMCMNQTTCRRCSAKTRASTVQGTSHRARKGLSHMPKDVVRLLQEDLSTRCCKLPQDSIAEVVSPVNGSHGCNFQSLNPICHASRERARNTDNTSLSQRGVPAKTRLLESVNAQRTQ